MVRQHGAVPAISEVFRELGQQWLGNVEETAPRIELVNRHAVHSGGVAQAQFAYPAPGFRYLG